MIPDDKDLTALNRYACTDGYLEVGVYTTHNMLHSAYRLEGQLWQIPKPGRSADVAYKVSYLFGSQGKNPAVTKDEVWRQIENLLYDGKD